MSHDCKYWDDIKFCKVRRQNNDFFFKKSALCGMQGKIDVATPSLLSTQVRLKINSHSTCLETGVKFRQRLSPCIG